MLPNVTVKDDLQQRRCLSPFHLAPCVLAAWISYMTGVHLLLGYPLPIATFASTTDVQDADSVSDVEPDNTPRLATTASAAAPPSSQMTR